MTQMLKKLWHDPVGSAVISAIIFAIGASTASYFLNWWPAIRKLVAQLYALGFEFSSISNWVLLCLCLLALPTVIYICTLTWKYIHPSKSLPITWRSYTTDIFFKLRWRWKYLEDDSFIDIYTYCPHCDYQVYPKDSASYHMINNISYHCESCGRNLLELQETFASLSNKVVRLAQQKIRNKAWNIPNKL
jgi:hypothetical protein